MVLIDAVYINSGGGKTLLDYFIKIYLSKYNHLKFHFLLDRRIEKDYKSLENSLFIRSTIYNRYKFYKKNKNLYKIVFCFANIPPPIKLDSIVYTYFHQAKLLHSFPNIGCKEFFILSLKKFYFFYFKDYTNKFLVQTSYIKRDLQKKYNLKELDIYVLPFYDNSFGETKSSNLIKKRNTFLYVSNAGAHKNHSNLLHAFVRFYLQYNTGILYLTVSEENTLIIDLINLYKKSDIPIVNLGTINHLELIEYYKVSEYFIYPSLIESFGLGLIEALQFNCKLIAANLDYTFEVCNPTLVFDPLSIDSIFNTLVEASFNGNLKDSSLNVTDNVNQIFTLLT